MVGNPGKKQPKIQGIRGLEHSGFFSPDSKQDLKFKLQSERRASHVTTLGRRQMPNCVLCCNSLHPIFEQLREKEEENQAFRYFVEFGR